MNQNKYYCEDCGEKRPDGNGIKVYCPKHLKEHTRPKNNIDKILEELAELEHKRWSNWQRYCHEMIIKNGGKITSPYPFEHWERQIKTPYSELSEREKESDRKEARNTLEILKKYINQICQQTRQETIKEMEEKYKEIKEKAWMYDGLNK